MAEDTREPEPGSSPGATDPQADRIQPAQRSDGARSAEGGPGDSRDKADESPTEPGATTEIQPT